MGTEALVEPYRFAHQSATAEDGGRHFSWTHGTLEQAEIGASELQIPPQGF